MGENWTTKQAAEFLQIKETTLEQWRWNGKSPRYIKMGRCVRYRKADLETFMNERVYGNTTEATAAGRG